MGPRSDKHPKAAQFSGPDTLSPTVHHNFSCPFHGTKIKQPSLYKELIARRTNSGENVESETREYMVHRTNSNQHRFCDWCKLGLVKYL